MTDEAAQKIAEAINNLANAVARGSDNIAKAIPEIPDYLEVSATVSGTGKNDAINLWNETFINQCPGLNVTVWNEEE